MSDQQALLLALAVAAGAAAAGSLPPPLLAIAVGAVLVALIWQRPWALILGAALLSSFLGARAIDGLRPPAPAVVEARWVTLLTDPAPNTFGAIGADVRLGRRRVQALARGPAATAMAKHLAGEKLRVGGTLRPLNANARQRLLARHISATLSVDAITGERSANAVGELANVYRRLVADGAAVLPERLRPLFGGMVLGDDRGQSAELQHAFRAAGLTHLMVVSGQNVAFALLVAAPLLRRGRLWWRFGVTLAILFAFGTLTRWEPSVVRAEAMAVVAAAGMLTGRPAPAVRLLALAATGCMLIDPLLVRSVGFQLSVAACAGLAGLTPALRRRRVPAVLAASAAAQVGAAVVLLPVFGTVPLVSLPANVLAVPVAGPIMMWGLTVGPVAGLLPGLSTLLHMPTRLALAWEAAVAERAAALPIAPLGMTGAVALVVAVAALVCARRVARMRRILVVLAAATTAGVLGVTVGPPAPVAAASIGPGATLWVVGRRSVLSVGGRVSSRVLDALRTRRVHRLDVLVVTRPGSAAADAAWPLVAAFRPRVVLAPEHHQLAGARTARAGARAVVGGVEVHVTDGGPPLEFSVYRQARDPPPR